MHNTPLLKSGTNGGAIDNTVSETVKRYNDEQDNIRVKDNVQTTIRGTIDSNREPKLLDRETFCKGDEPLIRGKSLSHNFYLLLSYYTTPANSRASCLFITKQ